MITPLSILLLIFTTRTRSIDGNMTKERTNLTVNWSYDDEDRMTVENEVNVAPQKLRHWSLLEKLAGLLSLLQRILSMPRQVS